MGWFWSDADVQRSAAVETKDKISPPPGCPMHVASNPPLPQQPISSPSTQSCPVKQSSASSSPFSKLNPLNLMPTFSNTRATNQTQSLPTIREVSSIPRGDADTNWEYPSPQQMYHALLRKGGMDDEQASAVESMVAVHNFLNEGAWTEIRGWEKRFAQGLGQGWDECLKGEERWSEEDARKEPTSGFENGEPRLLKFMGRPKDMTPKATVLQWMGWALPDRFGSEPPFDRHDWFVQRHLAGGKTRSVRYVIDYYSGPPEPTGEPVFYLDVRPAIDTPTAAIERLMRWGGDVWYRASGASVRR